MKLRKLSLKSREIFQAHLRNYKCNLAAYSFENIYIWKCLFDIRWAIIENNLCIFFKDSFGTFLYLPPLGKKPEALLTGGLFAFLDSLNRNSEVSRIENVREEEANFYKALGYDVSPKPGDFIYVRQALADLRGNKYKSKRSSLNFFIKNYPARVFAYKAQHAKECLKLYKNWATARAKETTDTFYIGMMDDSYKALEVLLKSQKGLRYQGIVVEIGGKICAFSLGYELNGQCFCILYEVADLSYKGIAQFIFQEFCRRLEDYKYINAMDDSGLDSLRRIKLSYRPAEIIPAYIVKQKNIQSRS
ncbi:MAG: phosphatidylglycerol lysyltransferase domain-containing protein [Candidatus Omnitrophica bacterium]|jgi:hypothetical protein|nr:phosphatidylglycerol lysyltransferase domain-containing protein [Candidatus Omnitrophota bacterium]